MKRILLVEDDYMLGPLMVRELEDRGYEVILATTYDQYLNARQFDWPFDVLITDYEFPGGNGCDVVYDWWQEGKSDTLVIVWSGLDRTREVKDAGLDHAVDHILVKTDLPELFAVLANE